MTDPARIEMMATKEIPVEDGALQLANMPEMEPYLAHIASAITGRGSEAARMALAQLPLQRRYIGRIVTGLKFAFCDFDRCSVRADMSTMTAEQFDEAVELIERRVPQIAILLATVFGSEEMERMLLESIDIARRY